jgi:hypothetical protein
VLARVRVMKHAAVVFFLSSQHVSSPLLLSPIRLRFSPDLRAQAYHDTDRRVHRIPRKENTRSSSGATQLRLSTSALNTEYCVLYESIAITIPSAPSGLWFINVHFPRAYCPWATHERKSTLLGSASMAIGSNDKP